MSLHLGPHTVQRDANVTISHVIATPVQQQQHASFIELDFHADTSCIGANCHIIAYTDKVCFVSSYHPKYKALENIPIIQASAAYDDQNTCKTFESELVYLHQVRLNNIIVDDVPC